MSHKTTENVIDADIAQKKNGVYMFGGRGQEFTSDFAIILFVDLYTPFRFITIHNMFWSSATKFKTCMQFTSQCVYVL